MKKKISRIPLLVIIIAGVVLAGAGFYCLPSGSGAPGGKTLNMPAQQKQFCALLSHAILEDVRLRDSVKYSNNALREDAVNAQIGKIEPKLWNDLYTLIGPSGEFKAWHGGLRVGHNSEPELKGTLFVSMSYCPAPVMTAELMTGNPTLYLGQGPPIANTFIPANSPLAQQLTSIDTSREVVASGKFVWEPQSQMEMEEQYNWMHHHFVSPRTQSKPSYGDANLLVSFTSITQAP